MYIEYVDYIPGSSTPARVFHKTGKIQVNRSRIKSLPPFTQKFIIKHEIGHYLGKTNNEFAADKYAFENTVLTEPLSLKKSIWALSDVLPMTTPEHNERVDTAIIRALKFDAEKNKNPKAKEALKRYYPETSNYEGAAAKADTKTILVIISILIVVIISIYYISKS